MMSLKDFEGPEQDFPEGKWSSLAVYCTKTGVLHEEKNNEP